MNENEIIIARLNTLKSRPYIVIEYYTKGVSDPIESMKAKIVGIYAHIFQVEEYLPENPHRLASRRTVRYTDIMAGSVKVKG